MPDRFAQARDAAERVALGAFVFDPDPDPEELPEYRVHRPIEVDAATFAKIVDRACQLAGQVPGHRVDRRAAAESVAGWMRALGYLR